MLRTWTGDIAGHQFNCRTPDDYVSALRSHYGPLDVAFDPDVAIFKGKLAFRQLGGHSRIARMYTNTAHQSRRGGIRMPERDACFTLTYLEEGSYVVTQRGRTAHCEAGQICLLAPDVPFEGHQDGVVKAISINIPSRVARSQFPLIDEACAQAVSSAAGDGAVIRDMMSSIWRERGALRNGSLNRLIICLLSLASTAFLPDQRLPQPNLPLEYHFRRIKKCIDDNFANVDLSSRWIEERLNISKSYAYAATRWAGTSVMQLVYDRRLEECRRMLASPLCSDLSITSIAFAAGFDSPSHFSRRFRQKFETTPKAYRERMQQEEPGARE